LRCLSCSTSAPTGFAAELARKKPEIFDGMVMLTPSGGLDFGEDAFGPVAAARSRRSPAHGP
jgi:hypothetical protein